MSYTASAWCPCPWNTLIWLYDKAPGLPWRQPLLTAVMAFGHHWWSQLHPSQTWFPLMFSRQVFLSQMKNVSLVHIVLQLPCLCPCLETAKASLEAGPVLSRFYHCPPLSVICKFLDDGTFLLPYSSHAHVHCQVQVIGEAHQHHQTGSLPSLRPLHSYVNMPVNTLEDVDVHDQMHENYGYISNYKFEG